MSGGCIVGIVWRCEDHHMGCQDDEEEGGETVIIMLLSLSSQIIHQHNIITIYGLATVTINPRFNNTKVV